MRFALILAASVAIAFVNADKDEEILQEFLNKNPAECMTILSRVVFSSRNELLDQIENNVPFAKSSKKWLRSFTKILPSKNDWPSSYWGQECDPSGEALESAVRLGYKPAISMTANELEFMSKLREHREYDEKKTGEDTLKNQDIEKMMNNGQDKVPVPSSWVWQDHVLVWGGIPMTLVMVGLAYKAFIMK